MQTKNTLQKIRDAKFKEDTKFLTLKKFSRYIVRFLKNVIVVTLIIRQKGLPHFYHIGYGTHTFSNGQSIFALCCMKFLKIPINCQNLQFNRFFIAFNKRHEAFKGQIWANSGRLAQGTFPDHSHPDSHKRKGVLRLDVTNDVVVKLVIPKIRMGFWPTGELAAMLVPKAAIHKNRDAIPLHKNIRRPRQIPAMQPIAKPSMKQRTTHKNFGQCILGMNGTHHLGASHRNAL